MQPIRVTYNQASKLRGIKCNALREFNLKEIEQWVEVKKAARREVTA